MKKLLLALVLLATLPALAGTLTITTTTAQDARLERLRKKSNKTVCTAYLLPASCTQPQARDAYCQATAKTAAPCTGSNGIVIHADVTSLATSLIKDALQAAATAQDAEDKAQFDAARGTATQAQKDAACAAVGLAAGCLP